MDLEFWIQVRVLSALGVRYVLYMCLLVIYKRDFQLVGLTLIAYFLSVYYDAVAMIRVVIGCILCRAGGSIRGVESLLCGIDAD